MTRACLLALATAGVATGAARAAPPAPRTGSLISGNHATSSMVDYMGVPRATELETKTSAEALRIGRDMAACVVRANEPRARDFVANTVDYKDSGGVAMRPLVERCLGRQVDSSRSEMKLDMVLMKNLLAEAMLLRQPKPDLPALPVSKEGYARPWTKDSASRGVVQELAVCLTETQPAAVTKLAWTTPGSAAEKAAFVELSPRLASCLPKNITLQTSRAGLRLTLSRALYERANASTTMEGAKQ